MGKIRSWIAIITLCVFGAVVPLTAFATAPYTGDQATNVFNILPKNTPLNQAKWKADWQKVINAFIGVSASPHSYPVGPSLQDYEIKHHVRWHSMTDGNHMMFHNIGEATFLAATPEDQAVWIDLHNSLHDSIFTGHAAIHAKYRMTVPDDIPLP